MHSIVLDRVTNGYIVRVGCMSFVFNSFDELLYELRAYHERPQETEKKWVAEAEKQRIRPTFPGVDPPQPEQPERPGFYAREAMPIGGGQLVGR